jgi:hypothetical protein
MTFTRSLWITCGLGLGIVTGLIVSVGQAVLDGWILLDTQLPFNLVWSCALGIIVGLGTCPVPRTKVPFRWRSRFSIRAMMIAVAVLGIILGVGIVTHRISRAARLYQQRSNNAAQKIRYFHSMALQYEDGAEQLLKKMKQPNPASATQGQMDSRQPVGAGGSYEARMKRYKAIAETVAQGRQSRHPMVIWYHEKAAYEAMLADKYDRAMWRPWLPVAPDPPEPPQPGDP